MSAAQSAYAAADAWRAMAEAAQDAMADAGSAADALVANNAGAAVDAFDRRRRELVARGCDGPLPRLVDACRALAARCDEYAARLSTAPF